MHLFKRIFKEQPKLLGRWNMTYEKNHLERKIYLANYDHCGPCGIIDYEKKEIDNSKNEKKK